MTTETPNSRLKPGSIPFILFWSLLLIAAAASVILFVGGAYFQKMRPVAGGTEGHWSALNHVIFLLKSAPIVIPISLVVGWWIQTGEDVLKEKLGGAAFLLILYGVVYFFSLVAMYPAQP